MWRAESVLDIFLHACFSCLVKMLKIAETEQEGKIV